MDKAGIYCYPIFSRFKDERKKAVTPRKYVPFFVGMLLLAALLLIPFSRNTNQVSIGKPDGKTSVQPVPGKLIVDQSAPIHVNVSLPEPQFEQLKELNRNFIMKYPHIQVELANEPVKSVAYESWELESQQGEGADIFLLDSSWIKTFAVRGYLKPVDSMMTGDILSDQLAGLLEPLKWNGYLWGVPRDVNPYVIVWSKVLLEEAGLTEPPADWKAYQDVAAKVITIHPEASILNWSPGDLRQQLIWLKSFQQGSSRLLSIVPLDEFQITQLAWLQTMESHISNLSMEVIHPLNAAFQDMRLLAAVMPWTNYELLSESIRSKLTVDQGQISFPWLNGRSYAISSNSESEEEAILWIQEMTDANNQQLQYNEAGELPTRASLYSLNSSIQVDQVLVPPAWWKKVLNTKPSESELLPADPRWIKKWHFREQMWKQHSVGSTFQLTAYLESLSLNGE